MNIALVCNSKNKFYEVYDSKVIEELKKLGNLSQCISKNELEENKEFLSTCELIFSTWGMPKLTTQQIKTYFPNVKALFYAAGTVQEFAPEFLECGIKVFSAFAANAVPVAEYTFAQIVLASKGYFQSAKIYRCLFPLSSVVGRQNYGNYQSTVGLVGLGAIGKMVAEKLSSIETNVIAYDPFVSQDVADKYNVKLVDIKTLFKQSDVISNHLANKPELKNFYDKKLFDLMKNNATFINTGRGAQVNEHHLAKALIAHPKRTAVIDVLKKEIAPFLGPLFYCPNAILTPHIAGSTNHEVTRMARYMIEQGKNFINDKPTKYEVTKDSLERMA